MLSPLRMSSRVSAVPVLATTGSILDTEYGYSPRLSGVAEQAAWRADDRTNWTGAGVPIPFRDQDERDEWGTAAYLRLTLDPDRPGYRGALFQINARGEPVEFTYNRVET